MSVIWILGAPDAEMTAIEKLLRECGQPVYYALAPTMRPDPATGTMSPVLDEQGLPVCSRVAPGQVATGAAELLPDGTEGAVLRHPSRIPGLVAIEVAGPWGQAHIDHHGHAERAEWGPDRFLQASSLGQVIERLAQMGALPTSWEGDFLESIGARDGADGTFIMSPGGVAVVSTGCFRIVPQSLVFEAAADHCPAAAIAGRCPGMDPGAFAPFLAESKRRQYFPWMSPEEFARELDRSRATLRSAPPCVELCPPAQWMGAAEAGDEWGDLVAIGPHTGVRPVVRDLRHLEPGTVPAQGSGECYPAEFLVGIVAAIFEGLGFVCRIRRADGKLALRSNGHGLGSLAGTRPAEVFLSDPSAFGCGPRFPPGQDASYGSPVRGFFGGLLIDQG